MVKIVGYVCEICHRQYESSDEAESCELKGKTSAKFKVGQLVKLKSSEFRGRIKSVDESHKHIFYVVFPEDEDFANDMTLGGKLTTEENLSLIEECE